MIIVIADIYLKEGKQEEFIISAKDCVNATVKEEGNISYELKSDVLNPNKFTFVETWESKEALDLHMKEEHFKDFSNAISEICMKPADIKVFEASKFN